MDQANSGILERLVAANIKLLPFPMIEKLWAFERDGFVCLVERTNDNGFGGMGSAGLLTERGMAALIVRDGHNIFVAKGFEQQATSEQVATLRSFATDLRVALGK